MHNFCLKSSDTAALSIPEPQKSEWAFHCICAPSGTTLIKHSSNPFERNLPLLLPAKEPGHTKGVITPILIPKDIANFLCDGFRPAGFKGLVNIEIKPDIMTIRILSSKWQPLPIWTPSGPEQGQISFIGDIPRTLEGN